jgi:hypothetical protein
MSTSKTRFYLYVDETGQDARSVIFIVAVVVLSGERREEVRRQLRQVESESSKGKRKWQKATVRQRQAYLQGVLGLGKPLPQAFFVQFDKPTEYLDCTAQAIEKVLGCLTLESPAVASVFIDGLDRQSVLGIKRFLRGGVIKVKHVRGIRDDSDEFVRLADAIAGVVRAGEEQREDMKVLYQRCLKRGLIQKVK